MNLTVFNIKGLRRYHFNLIIPSAISILLSISLVGLDLIPPQVIAGYKSINKIFFPCLLVASLIWSAASRKSLTRIKALDNKAEKIAGYERFAKKRMLASAITLIIIAFSWAFSRGNFLFYFLLFLLVLQVVMYPRKKVIAAELMDEDIILE